ncbi:MAG TPA: Lrp/AsnC family transcriptional regulator [Dehalococcoidales bacterium]|nr:Lrp/AsnC family transcriptional regulator [Dehalococcoidales bacterium]
MTYLTCKMSRAILVSVMDELDRRLVTELAKDARQSSAELSRKLGVSETTVRRRIEHLEEHGVIAFTAILNPAKLGYTIVAIIALEVDLGSIDKVSESLALCPNVRYVSLCTGNHDLFIGTWFHSSAELTQFVKDYLAKVPGIRKSETFVILDVRKDEIGWLRSLEQVDTTH